MNSKVLIVAVVAVLGVSAAGCDKIQRRLGGGAKAGGQVVATVEGQEITALELRAEMGGFTSKDPKIMKAAQDQALQQIIVRDLLAGKARDQKLDKSPQFTLQTRRNERSLLAQLYESKMFSAVAPPTRQEAENYVTTNPDKFAQRRVFVLERIVVPAAKLDRAKLEALKSMEEAKAMLESQSVLYQEGVSTVDSATASAETISGISKLPPGEVFIYPQGDAYVINRVSQTRDLPFRGELAIQFATDQLRKLQAEDFVRTQIIAVRRAAEPNVTYGKGYKPDNPDLGVAPVKAPTTEPATTK